MTTGCPPLHIPYKDWSGQQKELENYLAIERWTELRCGGECSCYIRHLETAADGQTIPGVFGGSGNRADMVEIEWMTDNSCGTLAEDAMLILTLNWFWEDDSEPPSIDNSPAYPGIPTALGVFVFDENGGPSGPEYEPIARHTQLMLGGNWAYVNGDVGDGGSITIPLNIYPAGQGFHVWVAQNSVNDMDIDMRADLFTVCGCSCVL